MSGPSPSLNEEGFMPFLSSDLALADFSGNNMNALIKEQAIAFAFQFCGPKISRRHQQKLLVVDLQGFIKSISTSCLPANLSHQARSGRSFKCFSLGYYLD